MNTAILLAVLHRSPSRPFATARGAPDFAGGESASSSRSLSSSSSSPACPRRSAATWVAPLWPRMTAQPGGQAWPLWMSLGLLGMAAVRRSLSEWFARCARRWPSSRSGRSSASWSSPSQAMRSRTWPASRPRRGTSRRWRSARPQQQPPALVLIPVLVPPSAILGGATLTLAARLLLVGALGSCTHDDRRRVDLAGGAGARRALRHHRRYLLVRAADPPLTSELHLPIRGDRAPTSPSGASPARLRCYNFEAERLRVMHPS